MVFRLPNPANVVVELLETEGGVDLCLNGIIIAWVVNDANKLVIYQKHIQDLGLTLEVLEK